LISENVVHFARALRQGGLPIGSDRVLAALAAIECVGVTRREDVHAALSAVMIDRREQQALFDSAFEAFWRDPRLLERFLLELLPRVQGRGERLREPRSRRLEEALSPQRADALPRPAGAPPDDRELDFDAAFTFSDRERLQTIDFETMTAEEFAWARRAAEELPLPFDTVMRRRHRRSPRGRVDLRATLQRMARDPRTLEPVRSSPQRDWPPVVVLLDISGSMDRYARLLLHYVHGLARRRLRVHVFTFGTRLTPITRCMRDRDPDIALAEAARHVTDWKGGTRIAGCLAEFNRLWARRVLSSNAAVLLMTDGLDRDEQGGLADEAARLRRHAHRVVWLNPLLRYDGFEPRAAGIRALLPHVDRLLPVHNLASLADLGRALKVGTSPGRAWRGAGPRAGAPSSSTSAGSTTWN
jgi:uncharacterized protein with von Willebrand factor type A (vWA) domain